MSINLLGSNLSVISARGRKQDNATLMSQIEAAIVNAKAFLDIQAEWGSFSEYIWHFTDKK